MIPFLPAAILIFLMTTVSLLGAEEPKINRSAKAFATLLAPTPSSPGGKPADFGNLRQRVIALVEAVEESNRSNGPGPESIIAKAYDFRDDVGNIEQLLSGNAILGAWREAHARGLFNHYGKFNGEITKGRGAGTSCVFELIIPAAVYPEASNQIANVRLVPEESKRNPESPLSPREASYQAELVKMLAEKNRNAAVTRFENPPPTNALGINQQEALALWQKAMDEAGEAGKRTPNIRLEGKVTGTPSHPTGQRWRVETEVVNFSVHPTETIIEIYLIGYTQEKRDYYLMAKSSHTLKLRPNESHLLEVFSKEESTYKNAADDRDELSKGERAKSRVYFRGFVVVAKHGEEVVTYIGSDQRLTEFGNPKAEKSPLAALPVF
jgi:hypothetical protein